MAEQQEYLGQQVGEYRLLRQLGKGSFGTVYLAEHLHDHSQAAVKMLRLQLTSREDLKDFLNEARTIRLRHPHIVPLLDFGLTRNDTPYLVMEYAGGGTLRQRYPKGTKLPLATIDVYVTQLASALQYAHDRRVIHRDVKPENMLLRADGTLLLSDFGIAKVLEQSSFVSLQTSVGTPAYMAPEQSQGKPCRASDQYTLAVIVYEWLAGRLPFQGTGLEVIVQHRLDEPPSLQSLCPEVPTQAVQVVLQALAKTPQERFSTVQQLAQALHTAFQQSSSMIQMTQQHDRPPVVPPMIVRTRPFIPAPPSRGPLITNDQAAPSLPSGTSLPQTVWPIDMGAQSELHSGFHRPPEISSASIGEMRTPQSLQFVRSGETQAMSGRQSVELPLQPPGLEDEPPTTHNSRASSTQFVPAHSVTVVPHSHNRRFTGHTLLVTLLCIVLLGGGVWTVLTEQHSINPQHASTTAADSQHATATAKTAPFATAQANILLSDPLKRNIHNWSTDPPNVYAFKDGAYHITNDNDQNGRASILSTNSFNGPIGYQLTMKEITGNDTNANNSFGMIFRFSQPNNEKNTNGDPILTFYTFEVVNVKGGEYSFWKYDNTNPDHPWTQIQDGKLPFGNEFHQGQGPQAVNTIKILMNGDQFTVTVNGTMLPKTFQDASLSQGTVGMIVSLAGTEVAFSNLLITRN